jgi:hypothetical protein
MFNIKFSNYLIYMYNSKHDIMYNSDINHFVKLEVERLLPDQGWKKLFDYLNNPQKKFANSTEFKLNY